MNRPLALVLLAPLLISPPALAGHTPVDHAAHAAHGETAPTVDADHQRWQPDAPLREGMRRMDAVVGALSHGEHGHLDPGQVQRLAAQVEGAAAYMFENCTLAPEPDAALHGILARLLGGARKLAADPADIAPVAAMREAVADYPRLFDDPAFEPAPDRD